MKHKRDESKGTSGFPSLVQGVVFDLDGTLMNTLDQVGGVANSVLEDFGMAPLPIEDYKLLMGNGAKALLDSLFERRSIEDIKVQKEFSKTYMDRYAKSEIGKEAVYPGIYELLDVLGKRRIPVGVLTNKPHHITLPLMAKVFPGAFTGIQGQQEGIGRKPDTEGLIALSRVMGFMPSTCVYLGDTNTDMLTARAYGAFAVGVLWGFRDKEELELSGAELVIDHPLDLLAYLED